MTTGSAGYFNDFITRDALQSMLGIVANDPPEAIYPIAHTDADGIKFNGANRYTMRFEPGKLPEVQYFWSLTLYDLNNNLVNNPLNRYAISSNSGGYQKTSDGSMTLYVQHESPGKNKESNWLPAPAGYFWLAFRLYGPGQDILDGTWEIPGVQKMK